MPSGTPFLNYGGPSAPNTALDTGMLLVDRSNGVVLIAIGETGAGAGAWSVTDDRGNVIANGVFAAPLAWIVIIIGDVDGCPIVLQVDSAIGAQDLTASAGKSLPGGKGARRPTAVRIQVAALGVGIQSLFGVTQEIIGG